MKTFKKHLELNIFLKYFSLTEMQYDSEPRNDSS